MYDIEANKANTGLYGINKGFAQEFDNSGIENVALRKQAQQQAQQKQKEAKLTGLMSDISKIGKGEIRPADIGYFADKQKAVYDATKKAFSDSKGGDLSINQQIALEGQIAGIQREATISGARHKQNMQEYQKAVLNPDLYDDPEEIAKIQADSFDTANGGKFNAPLQTLTKRYDITKGINSEVAPLFAQNNPSVENSSPLDGNQVSITKNVRTPELASKAVFDWAKTNPEALRQAHKEISRNPELQSKYNHENDSDYLAKYISDKYSNPLVNESVVKNDTRPLPKETEFEYKKRMGLLDFGKSEDTQQISTPEKPIQYNINTPSNSGNSNTVLPVNVAAQYNIDKKNAPKDIVLTVPTDAKDIDGNDAYNEVGSVKFSGNQIKVVPTYKKGVSSKGLIGKKDAQGNNITKEIDFSGRIIPASEEEKQLKLGNVEYVPMAFGLASKNTDNSNPDATGNAHPLKDNTSIMFNANSLNGLLGKSEGLLKQANEFADKKNKELGINTQEKSHAGSHGMESEKRFILNGKAYKKSALEKQGYDISKLQEYK